MDAHKIVAEAMTGMIQNARKAGIGVSRREDGRFQFDKEWIFTPDLPWIFIKADDRMNCLLWRDVTYNIISRRLRKSYQFVPTGCQECYKVVVKIHTYLDMLSLEKAMTAANWPSKIGIERRPYVKGLYGAYFYNRGLDEGLKRLEEVKQLYIDAECGALDPEIYLKRGCTEMEMEQGRSDQWKTTVLQTNIERIMGLTLYTKSQKLQTDAEKADIRDKWADFAWKFDPYYNGNGKHKPCKRYDNV
jgi:hypothetical protein